MKTQNRNIILADLAIIFMALLWGGGFAGNKILLNNGIQPMQLIALRFIIASIFLCFIFRKKIKINKSILIAGMVIGFALAISYIVQTIGLKYTTASNNAFLTSVYVILVPLISYFITRCKADTYNLVAAFLVVIGICLLTVDFSTFTLGRATIKGDMLTLVSAVCFAVDVALVAYYSKKYDPVMLAVIQIIFVAIFSTASALMFEGPYFTISKNGIFILLYLGVLATALCLLIQNVAQKYTTPTHAGILMSLESVFGTILGILILHEKISGQMVYGFTVIFIALLISETKLEFFKKIITYNKKALAQKKN